VVEEDFRRLLADAVGVNIRWLTEQMISPARGDKAAPEARAATERVVKAAMATKPYDVHAIGAVIMGYDGRLFLARRAPMKASGGLWEFPGGKPEAGEGAEQTLVRELREEFGFDYLEEEPTFLASVTVPADRSGPKPVLRLDLYLCFINGQEPQFTMTPDHDDTGYFGERDIVAMSDVLCLADAVALPLVRAELRRIADAYVGAVDNAPRWAQVWSSKNLNR
jgi:mutator protein MutT